MGKLRDLLEAYRWLWRAERRWHPASRWVSGVRFSVRVIADTVRAVRTVLRGGDALSHMKRVALGSVLAFVAFALVMRDEEPRRAEDVLWANEGGGFTFAIPAAWEASPTQTDRSLSESYSVVTESEHRRRVGGLFRPRYLTARTLALGVVPNGMRIRELADLVTRARAPDEILGQAAQAAPGVYIATSRSMERGDPISQAGVFLRSLEGRGFMIELTSHRRDEALLLEEAWRIADAVQHDEEPLADLTIALAESFAIPFPIPFTRNLPGSVVINWPVPDSTGTIVFPDGRVNIDSMEGCLHAAIRDWAFGLQNAIAQDMSFSRPIEMRLVCRTSSVTLRFDRAESRMTIRQVDTAGGVRLEEDVPASFWLLPLLR